MTEKNKAIIEMLICAMLWSIAGILMKLLPWNGLAVASLRSLIAGITFIVYMLITRKSFIINKMTLLSGGLTGLVYICFSCANKFTTAANAIVLQFTSPIFVLIISAVFFKAKVKKRDIITVAITLFGIALFFFDELNPGNIKGNILAILAGLFMAAMFVLVGNIEGDERYSAICIGQFVAFIIGLPTVIITKPVINTTTLFAIISLGVFQLGISYILYVKSSACCPPLACCLLSGLEPLFNPIWVLLFYGEKPGIFAFIGGIIVVVTITVWCALGAKDESETA